MDKGDFSDNYSTGAPLFARRGSSGQLGCENETERPLSPLAGSLLIGGLFAGWFGLRRLISLAENGHGNTIAIAIAIGVVAMLVVSKRRQKRHAVRRLQDQGLSPREAENEWRQKNAEMARAGRLLGLFQIIIGAAFLLVSILGTALTYWLAEPGGIYFVAGGGIVMGLILLLRGLAQLVTGTAFN